MNTSKVVIFLSCLFATTLTAPLVTAAAHGGGHAGHPGMSMPARPGMGMPGRPGMGMLSGGNQHGGDLHHHFDHFDHFDHHDHFHHHEDIDVIFIGSFGFPWWWGWGWDPWWGWGYPYGYYGYGDPYGYGYGNGYGHYGDASHSRVVELQRRLARAGYYHGSIDGVLGPQTRRAIRAYERAHGYAKLEPKFLSVPGG
jgi:hypothetical protein